MRERERWTVTEREREREEEDLILEYVGSDKTCYVYTSRTQQCIHITLIHMQYVHTKDEKNAIERAGEGVRQRGEGKEKERDRQREEEREREDEGEGVQRGWWWWGWWCGWRE